MTHSLTRTIDGHDYEVVSDGWGTNQAFVMVSVSVAEALDPMTIGVHVKALIEEAWFAKALSMADMICQYKSLTRGHMEDFQEEIAIIERFAGRGGKIDKAMEMVNAWRTRDKHRSAAPKKRSEISANYSRLFMELGRRDGFCCAHCKQPKNDLQIDHVVAVINGGGNELSNLQLLCAGCNSQKRDK